MILDRYDTVAGLGRPTEEWPIVDREEPGDRGVPRRPGRGVDRVLAERPQDPAAVAAVLEDAVAACPSDPAAAERWHEPELLDELVDDYEQLGRTDDAVAAMRAAITAAGGDARTAAAGSPSS